MSLISDALKKARQEAARQDSLRQGVPYAVGTVDSPDRRRTLVPLLAGLAVGAVLAGGTAGFVYFSNREPAATEETRVAEVAPPVAVEELPESTPPPEVTAPPVPPTVPPPVFSEPPAAVTAPPERVPEAAVPVPPPAAQPQPEPEIRLEPSQPSAAPQAEEPTPVQEEPVPVAPPPARESKSFVEAVPVPGGGTLRLNGIAFSSVSPVAVIDGKVVGPGEVVQGFTVVEIQQNRVKLEGHGETVYVSLK
ncbi:MAG TPA: hypothetical protein VE685_26030 [Thermoanaerobaculia bacterium]|nr:hypothetical protein [Thermoanaerobaculia bacterium]